MLDTVTNILGTLADSLLLMLSTFWFWLGRPGLNPLSWNGLTWMVAGLFLLMIALMLRGWIDPGMPKAQPRISVKPDLMISKGAIEQLENSSLQQLNFTISNMGAAPVQLLELIVKTNASPAIAIEAIELLLPQELVELEATLPTEILGNGGSLQAFAYVSQPKGKIYNLSTKLVWEAQKKRFSVAPTGQTLQVARKPNQERLELLREQIWQHPHLLDETPPPELAPQPEPYMDPKKTQTTVKVKKTLDLDFPTKF